MIKINLGDVVASHSHPYNASYLEPTISGEHLMIPPLMVVTEILANAHDEYSEEDGTLIVSKENLNCKCIWFSSKTNLYEEAWFSSTQLKLIFARQPIADDVKAVIGKLVSLSTLTFENGKNKSSLAIEQKESGNQTKTSISSLLSFVPPVMQALEMKRSDEKEKKFEAKSGRQKRFISKYSVKCKWYNPNGDKFSEKFLPLESLIIIPVISDAKLDLVNKFILAGSVLKLRDSLVKPTSVSYKSGFYYLQGYDFKENISVTIPLDESTLLNIEPKLYLKEAPDFKLISSSKGAEWYNPNGISEVISDAEKLDLYIRIKYKNREERISTRTLSKLITHKTKEIMEAGKPAEDIQYVEAYCHLRKETRFFRIDRIISIKQLNLNYKK